MGHMRAVTAYLHASFHEPRTRIYGIVQGAIWVLILLSIVLLLVEGWLHDGESIELLRKVDQIVLAIFAVEILLRVASFQPPALRLFKRPHGGRLRAHVLARLGFLMRPMMLVDILAVLAFFPELRGLRALRLLRLLRTSRVFRYRNPFAIVAQAFEENGLLFIFAFGVLGTATALGGVSFYFVEFKLNPGIDSMIDGFWWALVTITTVGFGDITPVTPLGRIIGAVLMVSGMFTLALFAGIVGSSLVRGVLSIREEQFRMSNHSNHVVVCGYDESTRLLVLALVRELALADTRVVFMDDHERPRDLPPEFHWIRGDATKESELDKVRVTHADAVILSGARDMRPQDADARTILTAFTIRSYLKRHNKQIRERLTPLYIVAEILDAENVDHARTAGADEVIETRKIGYSMIARAVRYHGTASVMSHFLIAGAHNMYLGQIPDPPAEPLAFGDLLARMQLSKQGGLVIGVRTTTGEEVINPSKSYVIEPSTLLIYLAEKPLLVPPS